MECNNPFFYHGPIHDKRFFFGRQRESREVLSLLANMQNVAVAGPPLIGKTSFLLHLARSTPQLEKRLGPESRVLCVYVSMEGLADLRPTAFFAHLLRETHRQAEHDPAVKGRPAPAQDITFLQFNDALDGLTDGGARIVWLLDEFDLAGTNPAFDLNFFSALRHIASRGSSAFVTVSECSLYDVEAARTVGSPFADLFTTIWLGPLQPKDVANMVTGLTPKEGPALQDEAAFIVERTSSWPFFAQMLAGLLYARARQAGPVSEPAREGALSDFSEQAGPHLEHIWSRLSARQQRALLEAGSGSGAIDAGTVEELLRLHLLTSRDGEVALGRLMLDFVSRRERAVVKAEAPAPAPARPAGFVSVQECVRVLVKTIEVKDPKLRVHCDGTARWALAIGRQLGLGEADLEGLKTAARLHDVGMVGISDVILQKPARLNAQERQIVQAHPLLGVHILEAVDLPWPVRPAVRGHHERMDGSGYPDGLIGQEIPLWARILAVAETVDFMLSSKPWRKAENITNIVDELRSQAGVKYDQQVVEAILGITQDAMAG